MNKPKFEKPVIKTGQKCMTSVVCKKAACSGSSSHISLGTEYEKIKIKTAA